jgi:hypothetical protein
LALNASKQVVSVTNTGTGDNVLATSATLVAPNLGTPASGVVTNLTGTASININGTVGATTASTGAFTTLTTSSTVTHNGGTANGVAYLNGSKVLTTGSALTFDGTNLGVGTSSVSGVGGRIVEIYSANSISELHLTNSTSGNSSLRGLTHLLNGVDAYAYNRENGAYIFGTNNAEQMRLTSTGLGIGTSSPFGKLHTAGGNVLIGLNAASTDILYINGGGMVSSNGSSSALKFGIDGTERLRITSSGDVGIGTSSPKLNTNAGTFLTVSNTTSDQSGWLELQGAPASTGVGVGQLSFNNSNKAGADKRIAQISGFRGSAADSGAIGFLTWDAGVAAERMRIDSAGNVGIGTSSPAYKLDVDGGLARFTRSSKYLLLNPNYNAADTNVDFETNSGMAFTFTQGASERMRIDSSGRLLVGTTNIGIYSFASATGVNINADGTIGASSSGTTLFVNRTTSDGAVAGFYRGGNQVGTISVTTVATLYNTTSDQRLKENIVDAPEFGSVIDSIQVRSFDWKTGQFHQRAGFVAQELVTVAPEAVHQPADPEEMMAVDYSKLVPMLVKEIQSLRARLAAANI